MTHDMDRQALIDAAKAACLTSRTWFEKARDAEDPESILGSVHKNNNYRGFGYEDVFTQADLATEDAILSILKSRRDILIVSEEKNPHCPDVPDGTERWLVDPIDGTSQFKKGKESFSVTLALQTKRHGAWETDIGVVAVPMKNTLYIADSKGAKRIRFSNDTADAVESITLGTPIATPAFSTNRSELLKGKRIENVIFSHSNPALMASHDAFTSAVSALGALVSRSFSSALVNVEMLEKNGVDAMILAGNALDFSWDTDAAFHIAEKAGVVQKSFKIDGEPVKIFAKDPALISALELGLKNTYRAQKITAVANPR